MSAVKHTSLPIIGFCLIFLTIFLKKINEPWELDDESINNPKQLFYKRNKSKIIHSRYVIDKLNECEKIRSMFGYLSNPGVTKLNPADRSNFRTRHLTEIFCQSELKDKIRIILLYSTSKSLDALERIEIHLDSEIVRIDFTKRIPLSQIDLTNASDVYGNQLNEIPMGKLFTATTALN